MTTISDPLQQTQPIPITEISFNPETPLIFYALKLKVKGKEEKAS